MMRRRRIIAGLGSLAVAAAVWLPCVHWLFQPAAGELVQAKGIAPMPASLARHHVALWTDPNKLGIELNKMRSANAEWDFMGRSFLVWSLANLCLRDPNQAGQMLPVMDRIIDQTLLLEREQGMYFFLMPYAKARPWVQQPARSLFVDGEIALMLGLRCLVEDKPAYRAELEERVSVIAERMEESPSLSAESYPDECWTFCNLTALSAVRVSDYLSGTDHGDLIRRWLAYAKGHLLDQRTGLIVAAYQLNGTVIYPCEGSTVWFAAHHLALLDEEFGVAQYALAKKHLAGSVLGFAFAREWPRGAESHGDVDSGLVVPGLGASVASSGLAFIAAGTYGDREYLQSLAAGVSAFGLGVHKDGGLSFAAGNQVGDAAILYGLAAGPAWDIVRKGAK